MCIRDRDEDALEFLADMAGGDARSALNAIELGILTTPRASDGKIHITLDAVSYTHLDVYKRQQVYMMHSLQPALITALRL